MIAQTLGSLPGGIISGYETLAGTFGSPVVLVAISVTLIALAAVELYLKKHKECIAEVR